MPSLDEFFVVSEKKDQRNIQFNYVLESHMVEGSI